MLQNELLNKLSKKMVANPDNYMESFRTNLNTYVSEKGITIAEIAEAANMSVETLKSILYGTGADVKLSTAVSLARALKISIDELVGSGTISQPMRESIYTVRNLPDNLVHFFRWSIKYHEKMLSDMHPAKKAINIMHPEFMHDGNLRMTNDFVIEDISDMPDDKRYKVFMGLRIPCEYYYPAFEEGDILYLANERRPLQRERVVVVNNGFIRIVRWKEEKDQFGQKRIAYYTASRNYFMAYNDEVDFIVGYIVDVKHANREA